MSVNLPIEKLEPHPDNIRKDLGDLDDLVTSIRAHGILQPLVVVPHPVKAGRYQVLGGNRRLAAARIAGLTSLPVMIRQADIGASKAIQVMLVENCQRADLNPVEKAVALGRLRDFGLTTVRIAKAVGISDATVSHVPAAAGAGQADAGPGAPAGTWR